MIQELKGINRIIVIQTICKHEIKRKQEGKVKKFSFSNIKRKRWASHRKSNRKRCKHLTNRPIIGKIIALEVYLAYRLAFF